MRLHDRRLRFVNEYALDGNGAAAAVRAGYSPVSAKVTACRLLTNVHLRGAVAARQQALAAKLEVTREQVLRALQEAVEMAHQKGDAMGMIAGLREQAKILGFYAPETKRVELSMDSQGLAARMKAMSDEELLKLAS